MKQIFYQLIFFILLGIPDGRCLHMVNFFVPEFSNRGDKVILECGFSVEERVEELYTVKWYKFDSRGKMSNFYTYTHSNQQGKKHRIEGVKVVLRESNQNFVTLKQMKIGSSGTYKCEVTSKRRNRNPRYFHPNENPPRFNVIEEEGKLQVVELAREPPEIQGGRGNYFYGDDLNLNCTSKPTYPPTTLTWYINDNRIGNSLIEDDLMYKEEDLYVTISFLRITVQPNLFRAGEIKVRCVAEITEEPIKASMLPDRKEFKLYQVKLPEAMKLSTQTIFDVPLFGDSTRNGIGGFLVIILLINYVL